MIIVIISIFFYISLNMGKRGPKRNKPTSGQKKVKQQWNTTVIPQQNALFRQYYKLQLQLSEEEFEVFWATMKEKLPVVFRVNPSCQNYVRFCQKIQNQQFIPSFIKESEGVKEIKEIYEPKEMPKIEILDWYPGKVAHQINTTKQIFKKSLILNGLHKYLQKAFDSGLIARQELVSMLPPLYLNVNSDDIILDMCAAPGSKTGQLLELIYGENRGSAKGCVIANDADYSRAQMLIHQITRCGTSGMAVINHPGQFLPELYSGKVNHVKQKFQFDKILCDVPCSGDGATRKIPIKWVKWHTSDGLALHPLQLAILMKSINLLKRGGMLVYSTCSLNPIENEAVLSALLQKVSQGLEIVDIHGMYDIKGRRGSSKWNVCLSETVTSVEVEEGKEKEVKKKVLKTIDNYQSGKYNTKLKQSMFPPTQEEAKIMNLHNSMRLLPHDQNSGGFFVALLKKQQNFNWKYAKSINQMNSENQAEMKDKMEQDFVDNNLPECEQDIANQNQVDQKEEKEKQIEKNLEQQEQEQIVEKQENKEKQKTQKKEEMIGKRSKKKASRYQKFELIEQSQYDSIQKFYGLDIGMRQLMYVRDIGVGDKPENKKRKVMLISSGVKQFLNADLDNRINLVNMGCKVFEKGKQSFAGYECLYRLNQEGMPFILPHLKHRKVKVCLEFFKSVLSIHSMLHDDIKDESTREQIKQMSQGSFCVYIDQMINGKRIVEGLVGQNFKSSFHLMVGKQELASLNLRYL